MTTSGTPPGDDAGPEQEGIWDDAPEDTAAAAAGAPEADGSASGFTRRLTSRERLPGPAGLLHADVPNRIIALIVDGIVLTAIGAVLSLLLGGLTTENTALDGSGGGLDVGRFMLVAVIDAAISLAYFGLGWRLLQGTPGMWLLGLRIVDESGVGDISWAHVLVRWLLLGVPWILAGFSVYVQDRVALVLAVAGVG